MKEKTINALSNIIVIGIILGLVALIMLLIPNRYEFSIQTNGVLGRLGDGGLSEPRNIKIDGVYTTSFFKPDVFAGKFIVEGADFTSDGSVVTFYADADLGNLMMYINFERLRHSHKNVTNILGTIFFSPKFEYFTILISEPIDSPGPRSWDPASGLFISGPANNRNEALRILYELLKDSPYYDSVIFR